MESSVPTPNVCEYDLAGNVLALVVGNRTVAQVHDLRIERTVRSWSARERGKLVRGVAHLQRGRFELPSMHWKRIDGHIETEVLHFLNDAFAALPLAGAAMRIES